MEQKLEWLAQLQGRWSATANQLKSLYERVRWITFGLSILGALAAAVASQYQGDTRQGLAVASAVLIGVGTILTKRFLGTDKAIEWVRARAASEALKRIGYLYASLAAPYDDAATRDALLKKEVDRIEAEAADLLAKQAPGRRGSLPAGALDIAGYIEKRVKQQADWYQGAADKYHAQAASLRRIEFVLALVTAVLTFAVGAVTKQWLLEHTKFDWVALTAVLTTISGAILAHIEASRYDFLVVNYRATERRLRSELVDAPLAAGQPSAEWSAFVERCESAMTQENGSWVARFSKP